MSRVLYEKEKDSIPSFVTVELVEKEEIDRKALEEELERILARAEEIKKILGRV